MTDTMGTVQNSYTYGAWGEVRAQDVSVPNSYGYTGREFAEDGMYFYRARYLDPAVGRFIAEDKVILLSNMNLYQYVENNPANFVDPLGLQLASPEASCCDKSKIRDAISSVESQIDRMINLNEPTGKITGSTLTIRYLDLTSGEMVPYIQDPSDFNPIGCDDADPCVAYCCKVHEWFHFTDYRPRNPKWSYKRENIYSELPAYENELTCLKSFL